MPRPHVLLPVCAALCLAACAGLAPQPAPEAPPLLRLAPAALGHSLALQQQITVHVRDRPAQQVQALLEVDAGSVRLALLAMGQTAARLEWNGQDLQETHAPWWPAALQGERVLSDLELVYWPASAIGAALPAGWSLDSSATRRELHHGAETVATVVYAADGSAELDNLRYGYRLTIASRPLETDR